MNASNSEEEAATYMFLPTDGREKKSEATALAFLFFRKRNFNVAVFLKMWYAIIDMFFGRMKV